MYIIPTSSYIFRKGWVTHLQSTASSGSLKAPECHNFRVDLFQFLKLNDFLKVAL